MEKIYIGLVGEKGSGKETFVKKLRGILPLLEIAQERFSDILSETLEKWSLPKTRENVQKIAVAMVEYFGEGTLSRAVEKRISDDPADILVLDGVRWPSDVELLRNLPNNILVFITANPETRFERLKKRGEKDGESTMNFEQFTKEEKAKNEIYISEIGKMADWKIENSGNLEYLELQIGDFCIHKLCPLLTKMGK